MKSAGAFDLYTCQRVEKIWKQVTYSFTKFGREETPEAIIVNSAHRKNSLTVNSDQFGYDESRRL